ncbi:uncharacterized protein LOC131160624 [Malania oleifera]|uniref:uncharacterized protein LOC131160624 n=1 Tax=Malania oleifera TaxID=397392 RepID=UPI0025AE75DF|nr:uncharacterized protein LOC131160624 [Malania oleifera]
MRGRWCSLGTKQICCRELVWCEGGGVRTGSQRSESWRETTSTEMTTKEVGVDEDREPSLIHNLQRKLVGTCCNRGGADLARRRSGDKKCTTSLMLCDGRFRLALSANRKVTARLKLEVRKSELQTEDQAG